MNEEQNQAEEEIKESNLSVKSSMWLIAGIIVVVLIGMLFVRSCGVVRKSKPEVSSSKVQTAEQKSSGVDISSSGSSVEKEVEKEADKLPSDSRRDAAPNSPENAESVENVVNPIPESKENVDSPMPEPTTNGYSLSLKDEDSLQLSESIESTGLVSSKEVYRFKDSYIYCINILTLNSDGSNTTCQYFCPSKTYSSVSVGDTLSVLYQKDPNGVVSISSISASK